MSGSAALRWGIISTARINEELLPGFAATDHAELVAVASRDRGRAEAYAAARGIPVAYGSYDELLEDDSVDCVYVSLPNSLHAEWTGAAIRAGKQVLCEKPLTPTAAEARELFELAERHGVLLMEAFMYRHHPKTKLLREIVERGDLGEPRALRMRFHFQVADPESDIRYDPELAGGALRDVGCYCVSLANYIAGSAPDDLGATARPAASGVDETFAATLRYGGGMLAVFDCGMSTPLDIGAEILGTAGRAVVETPWYPHLEPLSVAVETAEASSVEAAPGSNAYQLQIENFCMAVRGDAAPEISSEETVRNLETIERLLGAAASAPSVAAQGIR